MRVSEHWHKNYYYQILDRLLINSSTSALDQNFNQSLFEGLFEVWPSMMFLAIFSAAFPFLTQVWQNFKSLESVLHTVDLTLALT